IQPIGKRPYAAPLRAVAAAIEPGIPYTTTAVNNATVRPRSAAQCALTWKNARAPRSTITGRAGPSAERDRLPSGKYEWVHAMIVLLQRGGNSFFRSRVTRRVPPRNRCALPTRTLRISAFRARPVCSSARFALIKPGPRRAALALGAKSTARGLLRFVRRVLLAFASMPAAKAVQ